MIDKPTAMHTPVMLQESLEALAIHPKGTYVDLTFGGGGHAKAVLSQLKGGRLFAFDQDQAAVAAAAQLPSSFFTFIKANARFMRQFLTFHGVHQVDGILADLGVSSHQIDTAERGFSTRWRGTLDMRMDQASSLTAQEIVNSYSVSQLQQLLQNYGEVRNARTLAQAIVAHRATKPIHTTEDLRMLLQRLAPRGKEYKYYAKVFQSLRIEVNDELGALQELLQQSTSLLRPRGRLVVLSYHSLEDRLVKHFLNTGHFDGRLDKDIYGNVLRPFRPVYKKPMKPSDKEIQVNNRARSARLRTGERLDNVA
ncbi:MAG: 16S rRNA (cytosine(1402)-N(4))-methyltransferase RsmH [Amoebophilaceae bacterium]|jgi:16S rRNA (cytosine1402-N4)-methyltransferase|nr:16S rRNA (cytosine(1402)-N(4))-methyltransferase RsmH [Amoebophilaceae bacterium]